MVMVAADLDGVGVFCVFLVLIVFLLLILVWVVVGLFCGCVAGGFGFWALMAMLVDFGGVVVGFAFWVVRVCWFAWV